MVALCLLNVLFVFVWLPECAWICTFQTVLAHSGFWRKRGSRSCPDLESCSNRVCTHLLHTPNTTKYYKKYVARIQRNSNPIWEQPCCKDGLRLTHKTPMLARTWFQDSSKFVGRFLVTKLMIPNIVPSIKALRCDYCRRCFRFEYSGCIQGCLRMLLERPLLWDLPANEYRRLWMFEVDFT